MESVCARVLVIHRGKLVADGTKDELVERLAGPGRVRFEAALGADEEHAVALVSSLPGVRSVHDGGRLGIHRVLDIEGQGDLREDLGALAMARGWAVRELSWRRPSLEEVFARLVLGGDAESGAFARDEAPAAKRAAAVPPATTSSALALHPEQDASATGAPSAPRVLYSLNPFDRGAGRDLSKPMVVEPPAPPPAKETGDAP